MENTQKHTSLHLYTVNGRAGVFNDLCIAAFLQGTACMITAQSDRFIHQILSNACVNVKCDGWSTTPLTKMKCFLKINERIMNITEVKTEGFEHF